MTITRFFTINDVTSHLTETLGFDTFQRHLIEAAIARHRDVPYAELHGAALDQLARAVWHDVTEGAEWPWPDSDSDSDSDSPGLVEVPEAACPCWDYLRAMPQGLARDLLDSPITHRGNGGTPYRVTAGLLAGAVIVRDPFEPKAWLFVPDGRPFVLAVGPTEYEDMPAGTIDADVMVDGTPIGVTLCPAEDGRDMWVSYGPALDYWCSEPAALRGPDGKSNRELISDVLSAVDAAARRAGLSPLADGEATA